MVVDAECGMPLDLGKWEALWEDGADDGGNAIFVSSVVSLPQTLPLSCLALNPDPRNTPLLDPKDQALLLDPTGGTPDFGRHYGHGHHSGAGGTPPVTPHVSWLRKTEYISRDSSAPAPRPAAADMFVLSFSLFPCT
jgi:RNA polymerase II-associated factor 1